MAVDIDFIGNITNYQDIPDGVYPVLPSTSLTDIVLSRLGQQVLNSVLPDTTDVYVDWKYPVSDNLYFRAAVGYQLQVVEGTFSQAESQSVLPPGNLVFEHIVNLKYETAEEDQYIKLEQGANGVLQILAASLQPGIKYTVRARALVFSELGDGTIDDQYFKYTQWGAANFRVNTVPAAGNLRVNGDINPQRLPRSSNVSFSFTFQDPDGPSYLYQMQVTDVPGNFSNPIWDSGTVSAGTALGNRDFSLSYGGPALTPGTVYGWRVSVNDGISDGGWTSGVETFKINQLPTVSSIKANGEEMIYGDVPVVPSDSAAVSWTFVDADSDTQAAYNLRVYQLLESAEGGLFEILVTGNVFESGSSVVLPTLPDGGRFEVRLSVRDSVEFGEDVVGNLTSNAKPQALDLRINGRSTPGDVPTNLPIFTWKFFDNTPGDIQQQYQVQVATDDTFTAGVIVWDSGVVTSSNTSATCGTVLTHGGYYYARVTVSDGVSFSDYATGFFSVNTKPTMPVLTSPGAGSYSSNITVAWDPSTDTDGDQITYTLEITTRRSSNQGWEYLVGPLASTVTSHVLDTSTIKAGNDYGIRVIANDGYADSDPGVSPVNVNGLGFTILNHAPRSPVFIYPKSDSNISSLLKVEWLEADPVDVDGDNVFYILEMTRNASVASPTYEKIGVYAEGVTRTFIDVSNLPDGSVYGLRITAQDDKGGVGTSSLSETFSIINTTAITDFETIGSTLYMSTSDGRVFKATSAIWQVDEEFKSRESMTPFEEFSRGAPVVNVLNGKLTIQSPTGSTYMLRIK